MQISYEMISNAHVSLRSKRFCAVREQNAENPVLRSLLHGNACYAGYAHVCQLTVSL